MENKLLEALQSAKTGHYTKLVDYIHQFTKADAMAQTLEDDINDLLLKQRELSATKATLATETNYDSDGSVYDYAVIDMQSILNAKLI
jgi:hypothetical protein